MTWYKTVIIFPKEFLHHFLFKPNEKNEKIEIHEENILLCPINGRCNAHHIL